MAQPDELFGLMGSLGAPERLRVLHLVEGQELLVAELCDVLEMPQSTVSRHLKVLGEQGWITLRRAGTTRLYRMILEELPEGMRKLWELAREQTGGWATLKQDALRLGRVLRKRRSDPQSFFAGAAGEWNKLRSELYGQQFSVAALLSLIPADYVVADLGCGTADAAALLAPHVKQIIAVDNSPAMLRAAGKHVVEHSNIALRQGDLTRVPIEAGSCDAAMMILSLTYVGEPAAAIGEMGRVLRPGGVAVVVDLLPHDRPEFRRQMQQVHNGFSLEVMEGYFASSGIGVRAGKALAPESGATGPALFLMVGVRDAFRERGG